MNWDGKYKDKPLSDRERQAIWDELLKNLQALESGKKFRLKEHHYAYCRTIVIDGYELDAKLDQERTHGWHITYGRPYFKFGGYMRGRNAHRAVCGKNGFDWAKVVKLCMTEARVRRTKEEADERTRRSRLSAERELAAVFKRLPAAEGSIHGVDVEDDGTFTLTARGLSRELVEELLERLLAAEAGGELSLAGGDAPCG